ncbi:hypothetical protein FB451DRAFT_1362877 [Mycena latifolia]|nr:hypothetical protein FB451DRAFT_1362877 [Mycena latifolia]
MNIDPSGMMPSSLAAASSISVPQIPMSPDLKKNLARAHQSRQKNLDLKRQLDCGPMLIRFDSDSASECMVEPCTRIGSGTEGLVKSEQQVWTRRLLFLFPLPASPVLALAPPNPCASRIASPFIASHYPPQAGLVSRRRLQALKVLKTSSSPQASLKRKLVPSPSLKSASIPIALFKRPQALSSLYQAAVPHRLKSPPQAGLTLQFPPQCRSPDHARSYSAGVAFAVGLCANEYLPRTRLLLHSALPPAFQRCERRRRRYVRDIALGAMHSASAARYLEVELEKEQPDL